MLLLRHVRPHSFQARHLQRLKHRFVLYFFPIFPFIVSNIICEDNWLAEKINIYLLFQDWEKDLVEESVKIKDSYENYINDKIPNIHKNAFEKYGLDMQYQLFRNYGTSLSYSGYDNILKMSNNNPRIFLSILDNLFSTCSFNGMDLLTEKVIPCCIQDKALIKSSNYILRL